MKMITYDDYDSEQPTSVMIDKIVRLSKEPIRGREFGEEVIVTVIHLTTGEKLRSNDSIKTLMAWINRDE